LDTLLGRENWTIQSQYENYEWKKSPKIEKSGRGMGGVEERKRESDTST